MTSKNTLKSKVEKAMQRILMENQGEIGAVDLVNRILPSLPGGANRASVRATISILANEEQKDKIATSTEQGQKYYSWKQDANLRKKEVAPLSEKRKEEDFYVPFADYLKDGQNHLNECTNAMKVGGNKFGGKWGTPDVIGVFRPLDDAVVQFPHEIVSAEIKKSDSHKALMEAFGQVCAYRLFSHKTYLVIPETGRSARLESLCQVFGIGLVYFDANAEKLDYSIFEIQMRAQKHAPNMLSVSEQIPQEILDELYGRRTRRRH